jgi:hypothetical protein
MYVSTSTIKAADHPSIEMMGRRARKVNIQRELGAGSCGRPMTEETECRM